MWRNQNIWNSLGVVNMNFIHRLCFEVCNDFDNTLCLLLVNLKNCGLFFLYVSIRWRWTRVDYWVSKRPFRNMHLCQYQNAMVYTSLWNLVDYSCKEMCHLLCRSSKVGSYWWKIKRKMGCPTLIALMRVIFLFIHWP